MRSAPTREYTSADISGAVYSSVVKREQRRNTINVHLGSRGVTLRLSYTDNSMVFVRVSTVCFSVCLCVVLVDNSHITERRDNDAE